MQHDVSLAPFNTFHIDVRASYFASVTSVDALPALAGTSATADCARLILGSGSNILFTRNFDGVVLHVKLQGKALMKETNDAFWVRCAAGESWDGFVRWTLEQGYPGLENLISIPGTTGASPKQNIGAYGVELASVIDSVEVYDLGTATSMLLSVQDCAFSYRDSVFKRAHATEWLVTAVNFRLPKDWQPQLDYGDVRKALEAQLIDVPTPMELARTISTIRAAKLPDPSILGNAGSFFKNPVVGEDQFEAMVARDPSLVHYVQPGGGVKLAAGWLIEQCGWKGKSLGKAAVHAHQALVLVNRGGASGSDILALATAIQESVYNRFGAVLEPEALIL